MNTGWSVSERSAAQASERKDLSESDREAARLLELSRSRDFENSVAQHLTGVVLICDESLSEQARFYGRVTGRSVQNAELGAIGDADAIDGVAMIFCSPRQLGANLFAELRGLDQDFVPGVISSEAGEAAWNQTFARLASFFGKPKKVRSVEIYPTTQLSAADCGPRLLRGGTAAPEAIRGALSEGAELISFVGHADGVDIMLGGGLTLCNMRRPQYMDAQKPPYCQVTGHCFRHGMTVDEAIANSRIIDPEALHAKIFILGACHGILCPDGEIDPSWGFLPAILANRDIGAVVTSLDVITLSPTLFAPLVRHIDDGETLGRAVRALNWSFEARNAGLELWVFGDPGLRLRTNPAATSLPLFAEATPMRKKDEPDFEGLSFLRPYLSRSLALGATDVRPLVKRAIRLAEDYEYAAVSGLPVESVPNAVGPRLRDALLEIMYLQGTVISHTWLGMVEKRWDGGSAYCGHCGLPTRSTISAFRMRGAKPRHAVICPRCAISKDTPVGYDVSLTMEGSDTLVLDGELPDGDWTVGVRMGCQNDALSTGLEWPRDTDGRPLKRFKLTEPWPPGPLRVAVILINGLTLHILSLFARRATETVRPHTLSDPRCTA